MVTPSHLLRRASIKPSLLTSFLLASATILAIGAVALGAALSEELTQHAMGEARRTAEADIGRLIAPHGGARQRAADPPPRRARRPPPRPPAGSRVGRRRARRTARRHRQRQD